MSAWEHFLNWFRTAPGAGQADQYIDIHPEPTSSSESPPPSGGQGNWLARWRPKTRRDAQLASLQAGYMEMVDLIRSIRLQLENQNTVQQKMIGVLEKLPESMDQLKGVKDIAERQSETLGLLHKQMDAAATRDTHMMDSMQRFNGTLQVMDESNRASARTMENLIEKSRETERLLTVAFQRSDRRMLLFLLLFLVVIAAAFAPILYDNLPFSSPRKTRAVANPTPATPAETSIQPIASPEEIPADHPPETDDIAPEPPTTEPTPSADHPQAFDVIDRSEL